MGLLKGLLLLAATVVSAQTPCSSAIQQTTTTVTASGCTWTWLMSYPPMTGDTSVAYTSVVTLDYDAIDCSICSVTNIPYFPPEYVWYRLHDLDGLKLTLDRQSQPQR